MFDTHIRHTLHTLPFVPSEVGQDVDALFRNTIQRDEHREGTQGRGRALYTTRLPDRQVRSYDGAGG